MLNKIRRAVFGSSDTPISPLLLTPTPPLSQTPSFDVLTISRFLAALPDEQLLTVLQEVFKTKRPNPEEDEYSRNRFFLGTADSLLDDATPPAWGPWSIMAVAYPDRDVLAEGFGPDWGFCQSGTCGECGTNVRSNEKRGVCPICFNNVYMT